MASSQLLPPQPTANSVVLEKGNTWSMPWWNYWFRMDHMFRTAQFGPLVNAVDDNAAATAGVEVNGFYRTGSFVKVRVT